MPAEPLKVLLRGDDADCAIVAISQLTDASYADVVREVLRHDHTGGKTGLTDRVIRRTMSGLGHPVRWTKKWDDDDLYGLLDYPDHIVVLRNGLVIEPRATWCGIWDVDAYNRHEGKTPVGIYLCRE